MLQTKPYLDLRVDLEQHFPQHLPIINFMCNYDAQEGKAKLEVNHKSGYYHQVQGQLVLSGLPWCNFVVSLTGSRSIYVERIYFDKIIVLGAVQNVQSYNTALTFLKGDLSKYFLPINN